MKYEKLPNGTTLVTTDEGLIVPDWDEKFRVVHAYDKCASVSEVKGMLKFLLERAGEYDCDEKYLAIMMGLMMSSARQRIEELR